MPSTLYALLLLAHLAGAIVWVGGMVFAHFALRPAATQVLEPPLRLPLMAAALGRFFRLVDVAVVLIVASGGLLFGRIGFAQAPPGWHAMLALGAVMAVVFVFIRVSLYPRLQQTVAAAQWPAAGAVLQRIRRWVVVNLGLATLTVIAAVSARI